ncbi:bifunctional riboflavin kinase/FAD synthetase [Sphingomonas lacunae]|uniref:Riboflavin biosynthesis protein n=1 Tax=Sphingomonas lacunae TaxID=2698828 RepID=A0A6M4AVV8_9SPHN|nr:bifunctional riboflavin kinase/FAD synthetase [Sphingomonas lacunae]QJQ31121.1 bifunctional riboflavin kinase/FAD synthetase [Sphingomonas lacunae]
MQRLHSSQPIPDSLRGAVIALGNFDGFHLGHQAVVGAAVEQARARGCPAIVATFDPHPVRHFRPDAPPFRLTTLDQRQRLFGEAGADAMLVLEFGPALAGMTADQFIGDLLLAQLGISGVVTGEDFVFGKGRSGNGDVLAAAGAAQGFTYTRIVPVAEAGETVSSSRIREALKAGDCPTATRLLTRPFAIEGVVQHGDKVGRTLGFPTANIDMGSYLRPRYGIYAVTGTLSDGRMLKGAANIGIRPTFDPPKELLEPHFFDFAEDLYGQTISVAFHAFLRGEARFDSMDALMAQMQADCEAARVVLG